jgi:hypothetical protein
LNDRYIFISVLFNIFGVVLDERAILVLKSLVLREGERKNISILEVIQGQLDKMKSSDALLFIDYLTDMGHFNVVSVKMDIFTNEVVDYAQDIEHSYSIILEYLQSCVKGEEGKWRVKEGSAGWKSCKLES